MNGISFDLTFPHDYQVEETELPGSGEGIIYQPSGSLLHGKDGILLRFRPNEGSEWIGCFAFGHYSDYMFNGVFSTPNPDYMCVISDGKGYWVNASDPNDCQTLGFFPILSARVLREQSALLLSDFITLALIGGDGAVWRSPRLCWDELRILNIENGIVSGAGYNPINMGESEFLFDAKTRTVLKSGYPKDLGPV